MSNQNLVVLDALVGNEWRHITCPFYQAMRHVAKFRASGQLRGWLIEQVK